MTTHIVTDSNAQLPPELVERYRLTVVPLTVTIDGTSYREGVDLDADAFYVRFAGGTVPAVSTSQPSPGEFADTYARCAALGATEILSIHIGSAVSGTLNSARIAALDSPVPVRLVDTGTASFAIACCVWEAAEALDGGAGIDEAAAAAEAVAATVGNVFVVKALDLVARGGRLSHEARDVDGVPVLSLVGGEVRAIASVTDVSEAAAAMAAQVLATGERLRVGLGIADHGARSMWEELEALLLGASQVVDVVRYRVGPSVGAHTGPGTAGAVWYPTRVTG